VPRLALAVALCAWLLASCGGDDDERQSGRTATVAAGRELRVAAHEYSFDPANVVVLRGRARLRVTLDNKGSLAHNLKLVQGEQEVGGTPTFPGGRSRSATVELGPGSYEMICTVGNHAELGMTGKLEVRE
jgi:plastocyanin